MSEQTIFRIRDGQALPQPWQLGKILGVWRVANNDGSTNWHYEYDVEATRPAPPEGRK